MNASNIKPALMLATTTVNNASATLPIINTIANGVQFKQVVFFVYVGAIDIAMTAFKVRQSADSGMSGATDITATVAGAAGFALPTATDDNKIYMIACRPTLQYVQLTITVGNGSTGAALTGFYILDEPAAAALVDSLATARGLTGQEVVA
jgi:hypothetical protein